LSESDTETTPRSEADAAIADADIRPALNDAWRILEFAARSGALPETPPGAAEAMIRDVVLAQEAAQERRLTAPMVIKFWIAYGHLAKLVQPVSAASLQACGTTSLTGMKVRAGILVALVLLFSVFLFMSNATLSDTSDLIEQQNASAIKLWSDVQMLRSQSVGSGAVGTGGHAEPALGDTPNPLVAERLFEEVVEFSRKNSWLLQTASRLQSWFTPWWMQLSTDSVIFNEHNPNGMTRLNVDPIVASLGKIEQEALYQIRAYQYIRDFSLGLYKIDTLIYASMSAYILPTVYAILGAFLYGFRLYSRLIRRCSYLPSVAYSARYFIAAIAGLVVGLFGTLLPKSLSLPPLAIAFLVGYGTEAFFSRLDQLIRSFKGEDKQLATSKTSRAMAAAE